MSYTVLPNSGQSLGVTRAPINTNFSLIQSVFAENHVGFNNVGAGKHKFVVMPQQGSAPTTIAGEAALYTKAGTTGTALFMIRDANAGTEVQLTSSSVGNVQSANSGWTWLPGGLFMQWGQNAVVGGSNVIGFPVPFDTLTPPYSVVITPVRNSINVDIVYLDSSTNADFTAFNTSGAGITMINWIAIGKRV